MYHDNDDINDDDSYNDGDSNNDGKEEIMMMMKQKMMTMMIWRRKKMIVIETEPRKAAYVSQRWESGSCIVQINWLNDFVAQGT